MTDLSINLSNYLLIEKLNDGSYGSVNYFPNKKSNLSIINDYFTIENIFFPIPIIFSINNNFYQKIKSKNSFKLFFKNNHIGNFLIDEIYELKLYKYVEKIYQTKDRKHPGVNNFLKQSNIIVSGKVEKFKSYSKILFKNYLLPQQVKKISKLNKSLIAFHTRNIPHLAHEWIHRYCIENYDKLFIHPITGANKQDIFNYKFLIKKYKNYIKKHYPKNKVLFSPFFGYKLLVSA